MKFTPSPFSDVNIIAEHTTVMSEHLHPWGTTFVSRTLYMSEPAVISLASMAGKSVNVIELLLDSGIVQAN